jgi:hypothetical protein
MSPHQTIAVGVRLFAVWLVVYASTSSLSAYVMDAAHSAHGNDWVALAFFLVFGIAGFVLWFCPATIARGLLKPADLQTSPSESPDIWLAIGCALLGLWVLSSAAPSLLAHLYFRYTLHASHEDVNGVDISSFIGEFARLAFGVWLILGGAGFRRLFWWARTAGTNRAL